MFRRGVQRRPCGRSLAVVAADDRPVGQPRRRVDALGRCRAPRRAAVAVGPGAAGLARRVDRVDAVGAPRRAVAACAVAARRAHAAGGDPAREAALVGRADEVLAARDGPGRPALVVVAAVRTDADLRRFVARDREAVAVGARAADARVRVEVVDARRGARIARTRRPAPARAGARSAAAPRRSAARTPRAPGAPRPRAADRRPPSRDAAAPRAAPP